MVDIFFESIKNKKRLEDLTIQELAYIHLSRHGHFATQEDRIYSSLDMVLSEINHSSFYAGSKTFLPYTATFTALDQIGSCYKKKINDDAPDNMSAVKKALTRFNKHNLITQDIDALYGLRNSLLHNASTLSQCRYNKNHYFFRFSDEETKNKLIKHAPEKWDGIINNLKLTKHTTYINHKILLELPGSIAYDLKNMLIEDELEITIKSCAEFYYRFLSREALPNRASH